MACNLPRSEPAAVNIPGRDEEETNQLSQSDDSEKSTDDDEAGAEYSIFSERHKKFLIITASMVNFLGPVSSSIYYPAQGPMAQDLGVTKSDINLTVTSYLIVQGLVPLVTGALSDQKGRRPVLIPCLIIYCGVNIGLALQSNFSALLALRCLQSFGGSGASVISNAVIADCITRAERGRYMIYATLGNTMGPALGAILGGVLTKFLGWRSIFWFLAIFSGVLILVIVVFFRETCRALVGNGSVPPENQPWNVSILELIQRRRLLTPLTTPDFGTRTAPKNTPSALLFLDSIKVILNKEVGLLIGCTTVIFCGITALFSSLPTLLENKYQYDALRTGLCYLPFAAGSIAARWTVGSLADWNFARHSRRVGITVQQNRQCRAQLQAIPLEKARLDIALPLVYLSCAFIVAFGWILYCNVHIAGPLVFLFLLGNATVGVSNMLSTLILDLHTTQPATAMAGMNMCRSFAGAGAAAGVVPLIEVIGVGWVGVLIAAMWLLSSCGTWVLYFYGHDWRMEREGCEKPK